MVDEYSCRGEDRFDEPSPKYNLGYFSLNSADYREESTPMTQLGFFGGSGTTLSSETQVGEQEEGAQNREERLLAMMETLLQSYQLFKTDTEKVLEQHMEHILALERVKSSNDEIISTQAKKIKTLEETVENLRTQQRAHQKQQQATHNANLRRIKQLAVFFAANVPDFASKKESSS